MTTVRIDHEAVRQLALILTETGLTEIEVEGKEGRIRVARAAPVVQATVPVGLPVPAAAPAAEVPEAAPADDAHHPGAVLSPMVAFVGIGQPVVAGQTLLLIEAMKTFNQIKAPKNGTLTRILVLSGSPVEFGQPLMIIE